jgi:hypothetical protein
VIISILCGAELAGIAGIFLAIPLIAIVSVSYRHWMEHRGRDEGLVATLLQPAEEAVTAPPEGAQQLPGGAPTPPLPHGAAHPSPETPSPSPST